MRAVSGSILPIILSLLVPAHGANRTSPPPGCLVVSPPANRSPSTSGNAGVFSSLHAAVNSLASGSSASSTAPQCIFLYPGRYEGQTHIPPALRAPLTIYGSTPDTRTWSANTVTLVSSLSQASPGGLSNDETGTLRARSAGGIKVYNVDLVNGYGKGSQAIALSAQSDGGYYGCSFLGFQDTLLANRGTQVYAGCRIRGATDFIFGQEARAWFQNCDIEVVAAKTGYVTANGRSSAAGPSYYAFNASRVFAAPGESVPVGAYYLGRPWRDHARVVFQHCSLSDVINPTGWRVWNAGDERTRGVMYGEFGNTGPGAQGKRASFAKLLGAPVVLDEVLGKDVRNRWWWDQEWIS